MRIQRQRRILKHRLKVPPTLNQFTRTLVKNLVMFVTGTFLFSVTCSPPMN
jgi:hypothetical protein